MLRQAAAENVVSAHRAQIFAMTPQSLAQGGHARLGQDATGSANSLEGLVE